MEGDLQAEEKQVALLKASLEEKQTQLLCLQTEKQSSDAATRLIDSDVAESKSITFLVPTIL